MIIQFGVVQLHLSCMGIIVIIIILCKECWHWPNPGPDLSRAPEGSRQRRRRQRGLRDTVPPPPLETSSLSTTTFWHWEHKKQTLTRAHNVCTFLLVLFLWLANCIIIPFILLLFVFAKNPGNPRTAFLSPRSSFAAVSWVRDSFFCNLVHANSQPVLP